MLPIGTYKGGYTYACNEYDEKYFNEIVSKFFVSKPDPIYDFFDSLLIGQLHQPQAPQYPSHQASR